MINLDINSTTPLSKKVQQYLIELLESGLADGNPSSKHVRGQEAKSLVEGARESVARLVGCESDEVVFTASGTESNTLAIRGAALEARRRYGGDVHAVSTVVEHPATLRTLERLRDEHSWFTFDLVAVDGAGMVSARAVAAAVRPSTRLVSVMLANNEVGTVQPVEAVSRAVRGRWAELTRSRGAQDPPLVHTDAAQAVGKIAVDFAELGVDMLTVVGHKMYAPKGVAALIVRTGVDLVPLLVGGGQERGLRAATESTLLIGAFGVAAEEARVGLHLHAESMRRSRAALVEALADAGVSVAVHGPTNEPDRLPNTLSVAFLDAGRSASTILDAVSSTVAASAGAACSATGTVSHVLSAMGIPPHICRLTIRLSTGRDTTISDARNAINILYSQRR